MPQEGKGRACAVNASFNRMKVSLLCVYPHWCRLIPMDYMLEHMLEGMLLVFSPLPFLHGCSFRSVRGMLRGFFLGFVLVFVWVGW
jgi:hypothetical protein